MNTTPIALMLDSENNSENTMLPGIFNKNIVHSDDIFSSDLTFIDDGKSASETELHLDRAQLKDKTSEEKNSDESSRNTIVEIEDAPDIFTVDTDDILPIKRPGGGLDNDESMFFVIDPLNGIGITPTLIFPPPSDDNCKEGETEEGDQSNNIILGGKNNDILSGLGGQDTLRGFGCDDHLDGGADNDLLDGGPGNDTLKGQGGKDQLFGRSGQDLLEGGAQNDTLKGGPGNDTIRGNGGNDTLNGNADDDILEGGIGEDTLDGGDGEDTLNGGDNKDTLNGGANNDTLNGGDGNDRLRGEGGQDTLNGGPNNDTLNGGPNNDTLNGEGDNDTLNGGIGNDILNGGKGIDKLIGGDNDDVLIGGANQDKLTGGKGFDRFRFNSPSEGVDSILDFNSQEDMVVVFGAAFAGVQPPVQGNSDRVLKRQEFSNVVNGAVANVGVGVRFIYDGAGNLFFDPTGGAANDRVQLAVMTPATPFSFGNILVIS